MYETLEGEHIILRKAKESDWQSMLANVWGDEAVYRWMLFQPTLTEAEARDRCARSMNYQKENYAWFVALKDTDEAVGMCAIREEEPGCFEECGIWKRLRKRDRRPAAGPGLPGTGRGDLPVRIRL